MPLRRPTPPLRLETSPSLDPGLEDYGLAGSDDELDKNQRSAQRRRIERLGEAYLQGTSLFILSASLRGPLDKGWVNPWKKNRRRMTENVIHDGPTEQPVIPETNSGKRQNYHSPSVSRSSATPKASSRHNHGREGVLKLDANHQVSGLRTAEPNSQSPRFTRYNLADAKWLRKDNVSTRFQAIDPPTSPSTGISSRHLKTKGVAISSGSTGRSAKAGHESIKSSSSYRSKHAKHTEGSSRPQSAASNGQRYTPTSKEQQGGSQFNKDDGPVHVVSSSSQLPKFEYRLKQQHKCIVKPENLSSPNSDETHSHQALSVGLADATSNEAENSHQRSPSRHGAQAGELGAKDQPDLEVSLNLTNSSNTIQNPSSTNLEKAVFTNPKNGTASDNNLPSAQHAQGNPPIHDNLTSLYSIAVSKATSNRTDDHNTDQQFSTQAALMDAQRSFQNDLRSPERSPVISARKRRASHDSDNYSPNAVNITPFHRMNAPDRVIADRSGTPTSGIVPMMSTQYMMDAATPFIFSTEKKTGFRVLSPEKGRSQTKKRKTTSFALPSPSEAPSERSKPDEDYAESVMQQPLEDARGSPHGSPQSALPTTLTGTTPPTAQEGQGADSFNLSQAIAEAGSWLQQSFDINKDITQCNMKLPQLYPADAAH
ncbi:hypothetical protein BDW59DRAFT_141081 [Aspergillus cavernicola]|uniref:Uncharacterized protein n=1 Tax=Aspergillus cavernicola TaxID=176166 RepID=A0ABR4IS00_9EURO